MKRFFTMLIVACLSASVMGLASYAAPDAAVSQQTSKRHVSGLVTDESGLPVPGAAVVVQSNRTIGTVTDPDGTFSMMVPGDTKVLEINSLGYETALVTLTSAESYTVVLKEDTQMLEGTVVVGYGTMKRRDLTGAVSHVKTEELTAYPVTDPVYALQGRVPGVVISQNTGSPEGDYSIRIRGVNSIKGSNDPLYIIDGIPSSTSAINTYDIESLEVLKDASATAIYGSRGANGVVLITTKKGKTGKAKVQYDVQTGMQYQIKRLDLMNAQEWASFYNPYLLTSQTLS